MESVGSTGQLPALSTLFGSRGLASAEEEESSNAATLSTNLESDPVLEGLSDTNIPQLSILMNALAAGSTDQHDERQSSQSINDEGPEDASMYQSNVPNISLFGGLNYAPPLSTASFSYSTTTPNNEDVGSSTPVSSQSQSSSSASSMFGKSNINQSLPHLSFLMNNVQFQVTDDDSGASHNTITMPSTELTGAGSSAVQKFNFKHLVNCTNNFNDDSYTESMGRKLGAGGFGSVHLAVNLAAGIPLAAVKRLHRNFEQVKEKFDLEIKILSEHCHENLVKLIGYAAEEEDGGEMCLIYEFVDGGNLERRLELSRRGEATLDIGRRLGIAVGVAQGIAYLHSAKLIHRDVKSANVLLTAEDVPKVRGEDTDRCGVVG